MASLDTSLIRQELRQIEAVSSGVSKLLYKALEGLESNPSQFAELTEVPDHIREQFNAVTFRKIKLEPGGKHSYRIVVAHWDRGSEEDHVDGLYAFPRKDGFQIDWDEVAEWLAD
jgi:hypothetical protein